MGGGGEGAVVSNDWCISKHTILTSNTNQVITLKIRSNMKMLWSSYSDAHISFVQTNKSKLYIN